MTLDDDDYKAQVAQASAAVEAAKAAIENNRRQRELQDAKIDRALAGIDQAHAQITAAQAGIEAAQADVVRTQDERTRQEALLQTRSTTQQKVEQAVADQERFAAQLASRQADLEQAKTLLRSNELAAEAERRAKAVLESQDAQLVADLHAKEAALTVAQVNLGYTTIEAPGDGTVGERQVRPGQLVSPGTQVISFVSKIKWVQANYRETQLTNMKVGDPAEIASTSIPGKAFHGKVLEIAPASGSQFALLPPDNATGNYTKVVQRIPVKIALDDPSVASYVASGPLRHRHRAHETLIGAHDGCCNLRLVRLPPPEQIARDGLRQLRPRNSRRVRLLGILGVIMGAGIVTLTGRMITLGHGGSQGPRRNQLRRRSAWIGSAYNMALMFIGPFTVYLGASAGTAENSILCCDGISR